MQAKTALSKLVKDDREQVCQCALRGLIADPSSLDAQVNAVGAMHQALWLRNRIEPYLREFGSHDEVWMGRCLDRMLGSEGDDWAVRALLFSPAPALLALVHERAPHVVFSEIQTTPMGETTESIGLARRWAGGVAVDYVLIGWRRDAQEVVEVHYAKSVLLPEALRGPYDGEPRVALLGGCCTFGRFWGARLPYGSWQWHEDDLTLHAQEESERCLSTLPEWVRLQLGE